ncbi:MAG: GNAT family N-acetyltransferase, partial [Chloroflexota bacterium]
MINESISQHLHEQLKARLWEDDWAKMPDLLSQIDSNTPTTELRDLWQREYDRLLPDEGGRLPFSNELYKLFAPATGQALYPRYVADNQKSWYAVIVPRYNPRTKYRFCYVRYWWAADREACQEMIRALFDLWQSIPFDWMKLRLGHQQTWRPTDIHPKAEIQTYVVAGYINQTSLKHYPSNLLSRFTVEQPTRVEPRWWSPYQALLDQQQQIAPDLEDWNSYEKAMTQLKREMKYLLKNGGGAINLYEGNTFVGHISWEPYGYFEQLITRCWHINHIIVEASYRRQGIGELLHYLAAGQMNLSTT